MLTQASFVTLPSQVAWAVDKCKAAASLGEQARVAFEAGQLEQAIRLYHEAYRADPKQLAWLYNAARVEHTSGKWDEAEKHYREVLAAAQPDEPVAVQARERLSQLKTAQVERVVAQQVASAQDAMRDKQYMVAAELFAALAKGPPERPQYLFRQAKAVYLGGDVVAADRLFELYLQRAPADAADRAEAQGLRNQIAASRGAAKPAQAGAVVPVVAAPAPAKSKATAWALVAGGAAVAVAGGLLWQSALSDSQGLQKRLDDAKIPGTSTYALSAANVEAENDTNIRNGVLGAAGTAVGLAAAGVGLWWALRPERAEPSVAIAFAPRSALLQWRF